MFDLLRKKRVLCLSLSSYTIYMYKRMHWTRTNMTSDKNGQTGSSYLLIDTVLSQRMFDLKSGKEVERVPNNLGQQWPVVCRLFLKR